MSIFYKKLESLRLWRKIVLISGLIFFFSIVLVLPWRWLIPPTTAFMLQDKGHIHQKWVSWKDISSTIPIAVVAAEDQTFPDHNGFDFKSLRKAFKENRRNQRGASTISQQLAKNMFLWPGRSWIRKALEAYFTVLIELTWSKRRILEVYLNIIEFGPQVYGIDAASRLYFGKKPGQITKKEAALLAAVLPGPKHMSVRRPSVYVRKRASEIEALVRALGGAGYLAGL